MIVTLCSVTVPVHALHRTTPRHQQCTTVVNINIIYNIDIIYNIYILIS